MNRTLTFTLSCGIDSFLRVIALLRRKGIPMDEIYLSGDILRFDVPETASLMALAALAKLPDVKEN